MTKGDWLVVGGFALATFVAETALCLPGRAAADGPDDEGGALQELVVRGTINAGPPLIRARAAR